MVFDLETTGFLDKYSKRRSADIIQLAYAIFEDTSGEILEAKNHFFIPKYNNIESGAYEVHGLSEQLLYTYTNKTFEDYITEFTQKLASVQVLVGHNIRNFDTEILRAYDNVDLNQELSRLTIVDTMTDFTDVLFKVVCNKNSGQWKKEWLSLSYCYYNLLCKGYDNQNTISSYKRIFNDDTGWGYFHNAAFDVYINYLVYMDLGSEQLC